MTDRKLVRLDKIEPKPITWLWRDRIPLKGITILDGDPGDGKSTLMYDLAARVTTGRPMPFSNEIVGPAGVVLLQAEDLLRETVRPSLEAAGGDVSRIVVYDRSRFTEKPLALSSDISLIRKAVELAHAKLLVVDPITAFLGRTSNSETVVRHAFWENWRLLRKNAMWRSLSCDILRSTTPPVPSIEGLAA